MSSGSTGLVDLQALVHDAEDLAPLPATTARIAGMVSASDWSLTEISDVIRLDQALTGRLLGAANSVLGGARQAISSIDQAVMRLGPGAVLSIAIGGAVKEEMQRALPEYGLGEGALWRHAVASALAAELARDHCKRELPAEGFAAALLHDLGKLVLARHLDPDALAFLQRATDEGGLSSEAAEQLVLRVCHAEIGALVARRWGLPELLCLGIQYHHNPLACPETPARRLCLQIALADAVASRVGESCGEDPRPHAFSPAVAGGLGIGRPAFEHLCGKVERRLDAVLEAYA